MVGNKHSISKAPHALVHSVVGKWWEISTQYPRHHTPSSQCGGKMVGNEETTTTIYVNTVTPLPRSSRDSQDTWDHPGMSSVRVTNFAAWMPQPASMPEPSMVARGILGLKLGG